MCEGTDKSTGMPAYDSSDNGESWEMLSEAAGAADIGPIVSPSERELSAEGIDRSHASDGDKLGEIPSGACSHQVCLQGSPSLDMVEEVGSVGSLHGTLEPAIKETLSLGPRLRVQSGDDSFWKAGSGYSADCSAQVRCGGGCGQPC